MLNKKRLITMFAEEQQIKPREAEQIVNKLIEIIEWGIIEEDGVDITGSFKLVKAETKARQGINPKTKEAINIPSKVTVKLKVSKKLKDKLN